MPSRRSNIEMTPAEINAYLRSQTRIILVTNGVGGFPHPMPMNYGVDDQDRILMTGFAKSQKVVNLRRDPRTTLLVESGEAYAELKSVVIYANAEIIEGMDAVRTTMGILAKQATAAPPMMTTSDNAAQVAASYTKRVVLRFTPTRYLSWDHSKLQGHY